MGRMRIASSSLSSIIRPMSAVVVLMVVVVGVAADADLSSSSSKSIEVGQPVSVSSSSSHRPYSVLPPRSPAPSISHFNGPASNVHLLHPTSKSYGHKKQKGTRLRPNVFTTSANPFVNHASHGFTLIHGDHDFDYGKRPTHACPRYYECVPLVVCAPYFGEIEEEAYSLACPFYGGAKGICCPNPKTLDRRVSLFDEPLVEVRQMNFPADVIDEACRSALWQLEERDKLEYLLRSARISITKPGTPEYAHLQFFKTSPRAVGISRAGLTFVGASDYLVTRFKLSTLEAGYGLQQISLSDSFIHDICPGTARCGKKEKFYRTIDGSCNNVERPNLGQARTPVMRITRPLYGDGLMRPRISVTGAALPSARLVSTSISPDADRPNHDLTLYVMQWGQFIDHDLTHVPIFRFDNNSGIECCSNEGRDFVDTSRTHPSCYPIPIPADDPHHSIRTGRRCMNFVRSMIAPRHCNLGYAEQMNQITHFLDGSNIYGSSEEENSELRAFSDGLMKTQDNKYLPDDFQAMECESVREGIPCFKAGDNRVNEQVELTVIHTLWVRFHNLIAREMKRLNPLWNDETIFQETRRIVVAMYQHIVYNEWLPIILGREFMAKMNMLPLRSGFSPDYDPSVSPVINNEFATAAFRFGHTLVQGMLDLVKKGGGVGQRLDLVTQFNNPRLIYTPGKLDEFLRGLATQPPQRSDNFVSSALTNRLFETEEMPFGMDLVALNTQRGRDHAIGTYNDLREVCGLPRARSFEDFLDYLPESVVAAFSRLYASVDDVDAFVAGISERHAPGSLIGPTFRCIIGDQFARARVADRFFYDLGGRPTSFTPAQLEQIRRISFARILCEVGDNIMAIQPLPLRAPRGINERVSCDDYTIPQIDLTPWSSSRGRHY